MLRPGGVLVSTASQIDATAAEGLGVRGVMQMTQANAAQLTEIARLIDAGSVRPVVWRLPLAEARRAHELGERGHARGKAILRVRE